MSSEYRNFIAEQLKARADNRAKQHTLNVPLSRALEHTHYSGGAYSRKVGGSGASYEVKMGGGRKKRQTEQDREDERLAEEMEHLEGGSFLGIAGNILTNAIAQKLKGGAKHKKKQTAKDREDERLSMEIRELEDDEEMEGSGCCGCKGGSKRLIGGPKGIDPAIRRRKAERALFLGKDYGKNMMDMDDEVKELVGSGFWSDFGKGFMSVVKPVGSVAKNVLSVVPHPGAQVASAGLGLLGLGLSGGKKAKKPRQQSDKMKKRGDLVRKLMREEGMTLGQASKYIKEHNLI